MHFLELPVPPRVQRTPSQEEFVVAEEGSDVDSNSRRNSLSNASNSTDFVVTPPPKSKPWQYAPKVPMVLGLRILVGILGALCFILSIALAVFAILYFNTIEPFEVCKTKQCMRTANLFLRSMDESVSPCEDFPNFACGQWIADTAAEKSVATYDHTTVMRDRTLGRLRGLTENITDTDIEPLRQVKFLFDTCKDTASIETLGLAPLIDLLNSLVHSNMSLAKTLAIIKRATGQSYIFDFSISSDYRNTTINTIFIDQPQLPVDSSAFSDGGLEDDYTKLIDDAVKHLENEPGLPKLLKKHINDTSSFVIPLERNLSLAMADETILSKASLFNLFSIRDLNRVFRNELKANPKMGITFNWTEFVTAMFDGIPEAVITDTTHVIVNDLNYVKSVAKLFASTTPEEIELYLMWQLIYSFGKDVSREFRGLFYAFSQLLDGSENSPARNVECLNLLDSNIPFALTYRYIQKFVPIEIIDEAHEMVENLLKSFKDMVSSLDWMDENTKYRARLKADKMRAFMGYPTWLRNESALVHYYEGLEMSNFSFFENILTMKKWTTTKAMEQIGLPVDTTWSSDSPAEADAFYDDELNAITFPSGFLQEPFFGMGLRSVDYGALGSVIGHEITHGFDTRGRYSDENGRLNAWWSYPTLMKFVTKAQCFNKQYANFYIPELADQSPPNNHINGRRTLAENIADNGGLREAFSAYKYYIMERGEPEPRLPGLEKYTPEQLFFLSFGQSWCSYLSPAGLLDNIQSNEHSPARYRILGPLMNFDEFSRIWKCPETSFMNPKNKCILW